MRQLILLITALCSIHFVHSQIDSGVLEFGVYRTWVIENHPLSLSAGLQNDLGDAGVQSARGNLDPELYTKIYDKYYDNKTYYKNRNGGLYIPTWYGIEAKVNLEQNEGLFLNPENTVPNSGLLAAGISVPLGKDLFIDKRRAELAKAKIYRDANDAERKDLLNNLLLNAGNAYWLWFNAFHITKIYEDAVEAARIRKDAVIRGTILGDAPGIDTVEASIQLQTRQLSLLQAKLDLQNSIAELSIYLWDGGKKPMTLANATRPPAANVMDSINLKSLQAMSMDSILSIHPLIQQSALKINILEIEKRYMAEQLKPKLNLNYNALLQPLGTSPQGINMENYKWGVDFGIPIFLRTERGNLKKANIMLEQAQYDFNQKNAAVNLKIIQSINQWSNTFDQIQLYSKTVKDYSKLLEGEKKRFFGGESSLFMVNARELGYLNSQIKLTELIAKTHQYKLKTIHAIGSLYASDLL